MIGKNRKKKYPENAAFAVSGCTYFASMCIREIRCQKHRRHLALRGAASMCADRARIFKIRSRVEPRLLFETSLHP